MFYSLYNIILCYNSGSNCDANIAELSDIITKLNTIVFSIPKSPPLPQARDSVTHSSIIPAVPNSDNREKSGKE